MRGRGLRVEVAVSHDSKTSLNQQDESPLFDGPIPADLPRRHFDRHLLENMESDHKRIRDMSGRLSRLEVLFEQIKTDIARLETSQREGLVFHEQTATSMAQISNKLAVHTEMEEYQWTVVNESHKHLEELSAALSAHLEASGVIATRIDWMERLVFGIYGAAGTIIVMIIGYLISLLPRLT